MPRIAKTGHMKKETIIRVILDCIEGAFIVGVGTTLLFLLLTAFSIII